MRSAWVVLAVAGLAASVAAACQEDEKRADPIDPGLLGVGGSSVGSGAAGGAEGSAGAPTDGSVASDAMAGTTDVEAEVIVVTGDLFDQFVAFGGTADVLAEGAQGGFVDGTYDGSTGTVVQLEEVRAAPGTWLAARQTDGFQDVMGGIWPFDTSVTTTVQAPVVLRGAVDVIFASLLTASGAEATRAQLMLQFVDPAGAPLANVTVSPPGSSVVAYRAGDTWSDNEISTDASGFVAVLNAEALAFPGSLQALTFMVEGDAHDVELRAAADAVTIAVIAAEP